jgi:hypothetical protein
MYVFFERVKKIYSRFVARKSIPENNFDKSTSDSPQVSPVNEFQERYHKEKRNDTRPDASVTYSLKRRLLGFFWYQIILRILWALTLPERIINRLPIGASVFLYLEKPLKT